jgi:hypothetical protein
MGRMVLIVSDELEALFREKAMRRFGYRRGAIRKAVEEALWSWVKE